MHLLKATLAFLAILIATVSVCMILSWWTVKLTWLKGQAKSKHLQKMDSIIIWWTKANRWTFKKLNLVRVNVTWHDQHQINPDNWYIVICNHQSWSDILLLQTYLLDDLPPLKFFTKSQLIWIPFVGLAMYVLGFPYVKRVTRAQVRSKPELRNADRDNVLRACERFTNHPTSVLNFVEGTRFTKEKHERQSSEFENLLRPKTGGIEYVLQGMSEHLQRLVEVTIVYPHAVPSFGDFLQGKCQSVEIDIRHHPIPEWSSAEETLERKTEIVQWIKNIWRDKDLRINQILDKTAF
jgi:1-acyl-sn-glycerol-3-phosphate acyltransferase